MKKGKSKNKLKFKSNQQDIQISSSNSNSNHNNNSNSSNAAHQSSILSIKRKRLSIRLMEKQEIQEELEHVTPIGKSKVAEDVVDEEEAKEKEDDIEIDQSNLEGLTSKEIIIATKAHRNGMDELERVVTRSMKPPGLNTMRSMKKSKITKTGIASTSTCTDEKQKSGMATSTISCGGGAGSTGSSSLKRNNQDQDLTGLTATIDTANSSRRKKEKEKRAGLGELEKVLGDGTKDKDELNVDHVDSGDDVDAIDLDEEEGEDEGEEEGEDEGEEDEDDEDDGEEDDDDDGEDDDDDGEDDDDEEEEEDDKPTGNSILMNSLESSNNHIRLVALQELSELLVIATEEDFMRSSSRLNAPSIVRILVKILSSRPDPFSTDLDLSAEIMILACRCLYNLVSVNHAYVSLIAHSKGVEALVEKLMEIEFIDLAETALKVLEEISIEYPSFILKANGLFACLQFLDFFGIHIQRTAVAIVANTCRALPLLPSPQSNSNRVSNQRESGLEAFSKISAVMDTMIRLLGYSDQKVVESAAKSVSRITDWSSSNPQKLKEIFGGDCGYLLSMVNQMKLYADLRQTAFHSVFLYLANSIAKIAKTCPELRIELVNNLKVLSVIRSIIGIDANEQELVQFSISRPVEQVLAILDLLNELLPPLQAVGVWKVLHQDVVESDDTPLTTVPSVPEPIIQEYLDNIFPVLFHVFMISSTQSVRKRIVVCVAKIISYGPHHLVSTKLKESKQFGKFIFELVHYHKSCIQLELAPETMATTAISATSTTSSSLRDEQLLVFAGICIAIEVSEKFGPGFIDWFSREGVLAELSRLNEKWSSPGEMNMDVDGACLEKEKVGEGSLAKEPSSTREGSEIVDMLQEFLMNSREGQEGIMSSSLMDQSTETERNAMAARLTQLKRILNPGSTTSQTVFNGLTDEKLNHKALVSRIHELAGRMITLSGTKVTFDSSNDISDLLIELMEAGSNMGNVEETLLVMKKLAKRISDEESEISTKVTQFELFSGRFSDVLISFLSQPSSEKSLGHIELFPLETGVVDWKIDLSERIMIFMDAFFDAANGDSAFSSLILHLQELISHLDFLPVLSASSYESLFPGRENLIGLSKQLKIQLSPLDGSGSLQNVNIYVPGISSFKVLEHYIQTKIGSSDISNIGSSAAVIGADDDIGESDIEEDEIDISASPFTGSATEMTITLEKSASQASSSSGNSKIPKPVSASTPSTGTSKNKQHVSFYMNGNEVSSDLTIFGAVYHSLPSNDISKVWKTCHSIQFKKSSKMSISTRMVPKKQINPCACSVCDRFYRSMGFEQNDGFKDSKDLNSALFLINLLFQLNSKYVLNRVIKTEATAFISPLQFVNNKLSAKVARQISEPLMSVSKIYPAWFWSLVYNYSFLLPFDLRLKFLKVTAMGYARNMSHWLEFHKTSTSLQSSSQTGGSILENAVRAERLKVRINRDTVFESLVKLLGMEGHHKTMLEVEFFNEVGSGLGPTLEFFTLVCKVIRSRKGLRKCTLEKRSVIWRGDDEELDNQELLNPKLGLYPRPVLHDDASVSSIFFNLGSFVAKAFLDSRQLDIQFNPWFLNQVFSNVKKESLSIMKFSDEALLNIKHITPQLYNSLLALRKEAPESIEAMLLDFTLPGYPDYELLPSGANINVTSANIERYFALVIDATIGSGVAEQIVAFRRGFDGIIPVHYFDCFSHEEIMDIFSGESNDCWSVQGLLESIKVDHGYNIGSRLIQQLIEILCQFNSEERRLFLSFCTGSPRLPLGGFASLRPPLTIVRKTIGKNESVDDFLPSVMTCAHYLKVPEYSTGEIMRKRFLFAMREGQNSFHLS